MRSAARRWRPRSCHDAASRSGWAAPRSAESVRSTPTARQRRPARTSRSPCLALVIFGALLLGGGALAAAGLDDWRPLYWPLGALCGLALTGRRLARAAQIPVQPACSEQLAYALAAVIVPAFVFGLVPAREALSYS